VGGFTVDFSHPFSLLFSIDYFQFFSWEVFLFPLNTFTCQNWKGEKNPGENSGNHKKPEKRRRKRAGKRELWTTLLMSENRWPWPESQLPRPLDLVDSRKWILVRGTRRPQYKTQALRSVQSRPVERHIQNVHWLLYWSRCYEVRYRPEGRTH
jgi:hypothetical protein